MIQSQDNTKNECMYIAFELSNKSWKLMFSNGGQKASKINRGQKY